MGEATLKVPAEYVETFRINIYGRLEGEKAHQFIGGDPEKIEHYAVNVLKATRNIAALVEVMEQLGWTERDEEPAEDGSVTISAAPEVIEGIVGGCLVDVGSAIHNITDSRPFDRGAFDTAAARAAWLADREAELEAVGA